MPGGSCAISIASRYNLYPRIEVPPLVAGVDQEIDTDDVLFVNVNDRGTDGALNVVAPALEDIGPSPTAVVALTRYV